MRGGRVKGHLRHFQHLKGTIQTYQFTTGANCIKVNQEYEAFEGKLQS